MLGSGWRGIGRSAGDRAANSGSIEREVRLAEQQPIESEMIVRKNQAELEKMRAAGLLVFQVLDSLKKMVAEGVSTHDLEVTAEKMIADGGARAAFKGYPNPAAGTKFPYVLCVSVNDEIVHGMPSQKKVLKSGDIVSIDTGVQLNGYYGDSAITVAGARYPEEGAAADRCNAGIAGTGDR